MDRTRGGWPSPGLNYEKYSIGRDLPRGIVLEPLVWQCRLRPSGKEVCAARVLTRHVGDSGLDNAAIKIELERALMSMGGDEPVHGSHAGVPLVFVFHWQISRLLAVRPRGL